MILSINIQNLSYKLLALAVVVFVLAGCAVATKYETLRGIPSQNYSADIQTGKLAEVHLQKNDSSYPYLIVGDTKVYFATIRLSEDVVSVGLLLPIIPMPGEPTNYSEGRLEITILAWPEEDVISFYPNEFHVYANQTEDRLSPISVVEEKSYGYVKKQTASEKKIIKDVSNPVAIKKYRIDAASVWSRYTLVYDIRLHDVGEFALIPGPMLIKDDAYWLPDIEYKRFKHTEFD